MVDGSLRSRTISDGKPCSGMWACERQLGILELEPACRLVNPAGQALGMAVPSTCWPVSRERRNSSLEPHQIRGRNWIIRGKTERFHGTFSNNCLRFPAHGTEKSNRIWKPWLTITLRKAGA